MKIRLTRLAAGFGLVLLPACSNPATAPEEVDVAAAMVQMMELATPGQQHADLMALAGDWEVRYRYRMGADAPWEESTATMKQQVAVGGRWLIGKWNGSIAGMQFDGLQIMGYDKLRGEYVSHWLDSMSTWMVSSAGNYTSANELDMRGSMVDAITPEGRPYRSVTTFLGADGYRTVMYDTIPPHGEIPVMEMTFSRKK